MNRGSEATATRNPKTPGRDPEKPIALCLGGPCSEEDFTSFEGPSSSHPRRTGCCLERLLYSDVIEFLQKELAQPGL